MESGKVLKKRSSKGARCMKVLISGREKEMAEQELGRRIKMLEFERRVLISMERIAHGRLFAARSEDVNSEE